MQQSGYRGRDAFRSSAYHTIVKASRGLTRRINILADKSLLAAYADDTHDVSRRHVRKAIDDSEFDTRRRWGWPDVALAAGALLVVATLGWAMVNVDALRLESWKVALRDDGAARELASRALEPSTSSDHAGEEADRDTARSTSPPAPETRVEEGQPAADSSTAAFVAEPEAPMRVEAHTTAAPTGSSASASSLAAAEPDDAEVGIADDGLSTFEAQADRPPSVAKTEATDESAHQPAAATAELPDSPQRPASEAPPVKVASDAVNLALSDSLTVAAQTHDDEAPDAGVVTSLEVADTAPPAGPVESTFDTGDAASAALASATEAVAAWLPDSLVEQRILATRDWLRHADGGHFSIQLLLTSVTRRDNLEDFLRGLAVAGDLRHVYVYQAVINSRRWFGVLYREYPTFSAARQALESLPERLHRHGPFIRNVSDIGILG